MKMVGEVHDLGQCLLEMMANLSLLQGKEADRHRIINICSLALTKVVCKPPYMNYSWEWLSSGVTLSSITIIQYLAPGLCSL